MRWIFGIVSGLAILWGGFWFIGTSQLRNVAAELMRQNRTTGEMAVSGFPQNINLTLTNLAMVADSIDYQAPILTLSTVAWWPWQINASFASRQDMRIANQQITINSAPLTANLRMNPLGDLPLGRIALDGFGLVGGDLAITSLMGWQVGAQQILIDMNAAADALQPKLEARLTSVITPLRVDDLPAQIDRLTLDANLQLQDPMDVMQLPPSVLGIDILNAQLDWGDFRANAKGQVAPDAMGRVSGNIIITLQGAQYLPNILQGLRIITLDQSASLAKGLSILGPAGQISLPMAITDGMMRIGPLPLGTAPDWPF